VSATAGQAQDERGQAERLGIKPGQVVQEIGYDDDCDEQLRGAITQVDGVELVDEDYDDVVDVVLLWWRDGDGDLVDALVDALTPLADGGYIWLLTPKAGRSGHVEPSDIGEAAPTASPIEVREAEEFFGEKQKGSSAMPHKRNPVTSEQISGLARVVRGNAQAGFENVTLWHERDISHSSAERVILPDSTTLVDYLLNKTSNLVETMFVYPERMLANLESTHGLIFSGQLLLDLVEHGVSREDAYRLVQSHAMRAWRENLDFREQILNDPEISGRVPRAKIERAFDLKRQLKNIDKIFARVFPERVAGRKKMASAKKKR